MTLGEILYRATEIGRYEDEPAGYRERCEAQALAVAGEVLRRAQGPQCACGHGQPHEVEAHGIQLDPLPPRRPMIRATITDKVALEDIRPGSIAAYLESRGWKPIGRQQATPSRHYHHPGRPFNTIFFPATRDFPDYIERVGYTIGRLAEIEGRSQLDVLVDLGGSIYADSYRRPAMPEPTLTDEDINRALDEGRPKDDDLSGTATPPGWPQRFG